MSGISGGVDDYVLAASMELSSVLLSVLKWVLLSELSSVLLA